MELVAAWVLFGTVASCGLGLAAGVILSGGTECPVAPARSREAGRWQEQPEHSESGPTWRLDETRLGIIPRPGLVAGELGIGGLLIQIVVMSR